MPTQSGHTHNLNLLHLFPLLGREGERGAKEREKGIERERRKKREKEREKGRERGNMRKRERRRNGRRLVSH